VRNDYRPVNLFPRLTRRRVAVTAAGALAFALVTAAPASAHVEVRADGAQAGTGPVTLVFMAESESSTAGIVGVKTQLPTGLVPTDVSLATAPAGWTLTPTGDGFELGGPDIGVGVDAEYSVTIGQLPADVTELAFPTLQRYSDGSEDAWIEPVTDAVPDPDKPAPTLTVASASPPATTAAPSLTANDTAGAEAAGTTSAQADEVSQSADEASSTGTITLIVGLLAVVAIGAGAWAWRTRRRV
jgi:hypothetical protein